MDFGTDRVLVTGATGWLGRRLVESLVHGLPDVDALRTPQAGLRVRCLVAPGQDGPGLKRLAGEGRIELVVGDVRQPAHCASLVGGATGGILIHLAGTSHPARVREFYEVHVEGTKNVLDAAARAGVRRAVVATGTSACGACPSRADRFDESAPFHPYMHGGRSRMLMELAVRERGRSGAIEAVVVRAPFGYGPGPRPRLKQWFREIRDGRAMIVGDGKAPRSMTYVDNLCHGLMLAALVPQAAGQTYWIADQRPSSIREAVDTVERLLETEFQQPCKHRRRRLPGAAADLAQLLDSGIEALGSFPPGIHELSRMNRTIACNTGKAETELGYRAAVGLEEGLRRSLRWWLENGGL